MFFNVEQTQQAIQAQAVDRPHEQLAVKVVEGFAIGWLARKVIRQATKRAAEPWENS